jgi:hypothetical protein
MCHSIHDWKCPILRHNEITDSKAIEGERLGLDKLYRDLGLSNLNSTGKKIKKKVSWLLTGSSQVAKGPDENKDVYLIYH